MKKFSLGMLLFCAFTARAQQVIPLYTGKAPGSETWTWTEKENTQNMFNTRVVYNVTSPTLTAYLPSPSQATGTAIIICPGGGFHTLSIDSEGNDVAKWLQAKGVAAFVLKYRLVHSLTDDPVKESFALFSDRKKLDAINAPVVPLAIADGKKAMEYVRSHAQELGILPNQIGLMGFSAGSTVAAGVGYSYTAANRPDFLAPMYAYLGALPKQPVPTDAPPLFAAAASDDQLGLAPQSVQLYSDWLAAGKPAELHVYAKGGHGFGMRQQSLPTDTWIDRFGEWLKLQGLLTLQHLPPGVTMATIDGARKRQELLLRTDWANLQRYAAANQKLPAPKAGERRVVIIGNSITENWARDDSAFFKAHNYIGRGISGQTTPQTLARFRQDVIDLHPAAVAILVGTNDVAENTGPYHPATTLGNIQSMVELAQAHGIRVVLGSVPPAYDFPWRPGLAPAPKIIALNQQLKAYAAQHKLVYVDYHTALADERQGMKAAYSADGVHPNLAGYRVMEPLLEKAVAAALKK
ncbi:GDSL-type esterase/lipase family protein [Hymenobacter sp. BT491]|uniref:GDSL-type esterase/lipase family protein n=1 Tax=Hymenobacter sp. BT491 TaxID=2766779 RepID=UPI001653C38A|nr:GDSL-type esterase/lipase family protein [Hymenobacter sp. BT491]MBC6991991.1 alpha/beta hydrolase fold domain-containing protein [Hymenobacter sp. BT491]